MKKSVFPFSFLALVIVCFSCGPNKSDIEQLAAKEKYSSDKFLSSVKNKKAMVVVAHDDDCSAMAGTLAKLNSEGWEILQVCFVSESAERDSALLKAASNVVDKVEFIPIKPDVRRPGMDSATIPYMPLPKESIKGTFKYDALASEIIQKIKSYNPSVIFSLDHKIGGYGHPEHILVSQLLIDSFAAGVIHPEFIYQSVYPNSMEAKILDERFGKLMAEWGFPNSYAEAKKMYSLPQGMAEPDVEIGIKEHSEAKMNFLRSFSERERKTIGFYVPMFQDFDHREYFSVFDREFFKVIKACDSLVIK